MIEAKHLRPDTLEDCADVLVAVQSEFEPNGLLYGTHVQLKRGQIPMLNLAAIRSAHLALGSALARIDTIVKEYQGR